MYSTVYTLTVLTQKHLVLFTVTFQLTPALLQRLIFCPADDCDQKQKLFFFFFFGLKPKNRNFSIYIPEKCTQIHENYCFLSGSQVV